jgi:hypothetical protein
MMNDFDFAAMIQPVPATAKFADPDFNIWCGAGIKGDDGKYHLFYSRWPRPRSAVRQAGLGCERRRQCAGFVDDVQSFGHVTARWRCVDDLQGGRQETAAAVWRAGGALGREAKFNALERPQVLFENGKPIALYCAAADRERRDGSFNLQIPLKEP